MKKWLKIENGNIIFPPQNDSKNGIFNVNKNEKWLNENGFSLMSFEDYKQYLPKVEEMPEKYSTLKIIRILGEEWEIYRSMMEESGVLDQFYAANYLKSDDPVFSAFLEKVPNEIKEKLNECIWEEF